MLHSKECEHSGQKGKSMHPSGTASTMTLGQSQRSSRKCLQPSPGPKRSSESGSHCGTASIWGWTILPDKTDLDRKALCTPHAWTLSIKRIYHSANTIPFPFIVPPKKNVGKPCKRRAGFFIITVQSKQVYSNFSFSQSFKTRNRGPFYQDPPFPIQSVTSQKSRQFLL